MNNKKIKKMINIKKKISKKSMIFPSYIDNISGIFIYPIYLSIYLIHYRYISNILACFLCYSTCRFTLDFLVDLSFQNRYFVDFANIPPL